VKQRKRSGAYYILRKKLSDFAQNHAVTWLRPTAAYQISAASSATVTFCDLSADRKNAIRPVLRFFTFRTQYRLTDGRVIKIKGAET
jgi:hypothetical protein